METFCNCCGRPLNNSDNFDDEICRRCENVPNTDNNRRFDDEDGFQPSKKKDLGKLLFNSKTVRPKLADRIKV